MLHFLVASLLFSNSFNLSNSLEVNEPSSMIKIIENIKNEIELNKAKYQESIVKAQDEVEKYKPAAITVINNTEAQQAKFSTINAKNPGIIDKWINNYTQIKAGKQTAKQGLYIFVSFSLPKTLLESLDNTARKVGARLVVKGLKNNSFKETLRYIREIQPEGVIVDIDPESFEQFGINLVPAFVVSEGLKYDKIVGNVSISYTLNKFVAEGSTASLSKEYLKRLDTDA